MFMFFPPKSSAKIFQGVDRYRDENQWLPSTNHGNYKFSRCYHDAKIKVSLHSFAQYSTSTYKTLSDLHYSLCTSFQIYQPQNFSLNISMPALAT